MLKVYSALNYYQLWLFFTSSAHEPFQTQSLTSPVHYINLYLRNWECLQPFLQVLHEFIFGWAVKFTVFPQPFRPPCSSTRPPRGTAAIINPFNVRNSRFPVFWNRIIHIKLSFHLYNITFDGVFPFLWACTHIYTQVMVQSFLVQYLF